MPEHRDGRGRMVTESAAGLNQAALTELAGLLMATSSFEDLMQKVADLSGRAVPAAVSARGTGGAPCPPSGPVTGPGSCGWRSSRCW